MHKDNPKHAYANIKELAEQTFLLWIQLGLLLISVGFACVGLISFAQAHHIKPIVTLFVRIIGDLFVITGFASTFFSLIQYRNKLKNPELFYRSAIDLPTFIGTAVSIFGVIAFIAMVIDWL